MLDVNLIRADPKQVATALQRRGGEGSFPDFLALDAQLRDERTRAESLRAERKTISGAIGRNPSDPANAERKERSVAIGKELDELELAVKGLEDRTTRFLAELPNLPDDDIPSGGKEANVELRQSGEP